MVLMFNFPPRFYCFPNFLPQRWSSGWEREGKGEVWEVFKSTKTSGRKRTNRKRTKYNNNTISMLHGVKKPRGEIDSENFLKLNCKYKFFNVVM